MKKDKKNGGADWDRTSDPHNAIVVLYQLSYDPTRRSELYGFTLRRQTLFEI